MNRNCLLLLTLFFAQGCAATYEGRKLCSFYFNDKNRNSYIVDRFPDYGDGHKDGCIVEGEIKLEMRSTDKTIFNGKVSDAGNNESLRAVNIYVYSRLSSQPKIMVTNERGEFSFEKSDEIVKIKVEALGFRTLLLDFSEYHLL